MAATSSNAINYVQPNLPSEQPLAYFRSNLLWTSACRHGPVAQGSISSVNRQTVLPAWKVTEFTSVFPSTDIIGASPGHSYCDRWRFLSSTRGSFDRGWFNSGSSLVGCPPFAIEFRWIDNAGSRGMVWIEFDEFSWNDTVP